MYLVGADFLLLCDDSFSIIEKGGIYFDDNEIIAVDKYEKLESLRIREKKYYENCVITPSFANLHTHLEFSKNNGKLHYGNFGKWLDSVIVNRDSLMDSTLEEAMQREITKMLKSGISCIGAISSYGYDVEVLANSPLRVLFFNEVIGSKEEAVPFLEQSLNARIKECAQYQSKRFFPAIAIHSPYSVHETLLNKALEIAKVEELPLSVHFLESKEEREWLDNGSGYFKDFFKRFFNSDMKPFFSIESFLDKLEGLNPYFVHTLFANDNELERIKKLNGKIISCPRSNRLLNNALLPLSKMYNNGFDVIFATDGLSSNDSLSLLDELKMALYAYSEYDVEYLAQKLLLGVTNYAFKDNKIGLKAGILKQGYVPDFAVFKLECKEQIALNLILNSKEALALYIGGIKVEHE